MREAVIFSFAHTPIGKAYRGVFNDTSAQALAGHVIHHAVTRAGVEPERIDDVILGCAMQQGSTHMNIARQGAIRAGLPTSIAGMSVDRQCSSGLMATAIVAKQILVDGQSIAVSGGGESISLVLWCKLVASTHRSAQELYADHAARTAFQISGAVLSLMRSFPSLN